MKLQLVKNGHVMLWRRIRENNREGKICVYFFPAWNTEPLFDSATILSAGDMGYNLFMLYTSATNLLNQHSPDIFPFPPALSHFGDYFQ